MCRFLMVAARRPLGEWKGSSIGDRWGSASGTAERASGGSVPLFGDDEGARIEAEEVEWVVTRKAAEVTFQAIA